MRDKVARMLRAVADVLSVPLSASEGEGTVETGAKKESVSTGHSSTRGTFTRDDVSGMVEWEGGVIELLHNGMKSSEIADRELSAAWARAETAWKVLSPLVRDVERLLEQSDDGDE